MPSETVPSRRTYDSSRRQEQARARRAAILDACRTVLMAAGYAGLTIRAVAETAEVSQETIYKTYGGKQGLVKSLYDVSLAGDDEPVPLAGRPEMQALLAEPDPQAKIAGYAHLARTISERVGAVLAALSAGGTDAAAITAQTDRERHLGTTAFVRHLAETGLLGAGVDAERAADACWVLISPQVYQLCTGGRGWSADDYEAWLAAQLTATLITASPV